MGFDFVIAPAIAVTNALVRAGEKYACYAVEELEPPVAPLADAEETVTMRLGERFQVGLEVDSLPAEACTGRCSPCPAATISSGR